MQKIKFIILLVVISGLILVFIPVTIPSNFQIQDNSLSEFDFIIVFNPGGWGDAPLEKSDDFSPIVKGIQDSLSEWGYNSVVIPYMRTKEGVLAKISGFKDFILGYDFSSDQFIKDSKELSNFLPDKKIIITGLSNGAAFVNEVYKKLSDEDKDLFYAISVGTPFWVDKIYDDDILQLDNNGEDDLAAGKISSIVWSGLKAPFIWLFSRIKNNNIEFSRAFQVNGHEYSWSSPETGGKIISFLQRELDR